MIEIRNPARLSEIVGQCADDTIATVAAAAERADAAHHEWAALGAMARLHLLSEAVARVDVNGLDRLLVQEQGKVLREASVEMGYLGPTLAGFAPHAEWLDAGDELADNGRARTVVHRVPMGVVAVITPWNWPFALAAISVIPALLAGNAVVLFVAPSAPLASSEAFRRLAANLPEGVLGVVTSTDTSVPASLVSHPRVRSVSFTGGTTTGRSVMRQAAEGVKKLTLELGGNDAAILLDDVVLDDVTLERIVAGTFTTSGQVCMSIKRLYVPSRLLLDIVDGISSILDPFVIGDGLDPRTTMGPLHSARQLARVSSLVDAARAAGATVSEHGTLDADAAQGYFMRPMLVHGADHEGALVQEEQFGPVLPIIPYGTVEDAVQMANSSEFGLCSSVWSSDLDRAGRVARLLEAGTTFINAHGTAAMDPRAPYGGMKHSGIGRRGGRWTLEGFTDEHSIVIPQPASSA